MDGSGPHMESARTENAFRALIRAYGLVKRVMEPYFGRYGISGSQWGVLRVLQRTEQDGLAGLRLTDLGDRLLIRPPSVTGVVDRLERQGLVARTTSTEDLRARHVSLTPTGRQLVERILRGHAERVESLLEGLRPEERAQLHRLLDQMAAHLELMVEQEETAVR